LSKQGRASGPHTSVISYIGSGPSLTARAHLWFASIYGKAPRAVRTMGAANSRSNVKAPSGTRLVEGSKSYAPLARALIGGSSVSVLIPVFLVPAGFCLAYARQEVSAGPINE
jgi:hypothetical protein